MKVAPTRFDISGRLRFLPLGPHLPADSGDFVTISHSGFPDAPPLLTRASEVATRLFSGHTLVLDENPALRRLDQREMEFWRESGIHYFVPCVSKEGTIAVMALGRKSNTEPLSSEDMALLSPSPPRRRPRWRTGGCTGNCGPRPKSSSVCAASARTFSNR